MNIKNILRNWVISAISQPKNNIKIEISQILYGSLFVDKNIVVTGGSKGIGYAIAKKLIGEGAEVIISGRNEKDLKEAVSNLGEGAHYVVFDNNHIDEIENFLFECDAKYGKIHSIVLNAGISLHEGNFLNVTSEGFSKQFDVNLKSNFFFAKSFIKYKMSKRESGSLLFVSSETGGKFNDLPYGLTKNAINSLVGGLARRVYQCGIRVNAIAPGVTYTNMTKGEHEITEDYSNNSVAGRFLLPSEIAEVASFILSDASLCINGETIYCDAGSHLKINGLDQYYSL